MFNFKDKVVYQIYPKSFYDSNNDGVGDIKGITLKLDYLKNLGIDYIWMNPIFVSPQKDNGYDIADYKHIDPAFGTMEDLEELISEAKKRDIYLMFDMVLNHTSIEHEWFKKAMAGDEKYKNYYYFKKPKADGSMPTNWDSKFGGPCWEYVEKFDEYYLHLYDVTMADLNWSNPDVRKEVQDIVQFWLDKGIRGLRFDVINVIDKMKFEDDYEGVGKRFYTDGARVHDYLRELNEATFGHYEGMVTVGEMSSTSIENCIGYSNPDNHELSMAFNFHHLKVDYKNKEKWTLMPFDFKELKDLFNTWELGMQENNGWNALFWNCHDQPRSISRFGNDTKYHKESAKMLAASIHLQRGTPYIYMGEEIGMTNAYFTDLSQYKDVESINYYHIMKDEGYTDEKIYEILQAKSRDNARTPMQWTSSGGFSTHTPWIEMNPRCKDINVEDALKDKDSIYYFYKKLIELRKTYKVISEGTYTPLFEESDCLYAFKRNYENEELIVLNNFYDVETTVSIDNIEDYEVMISNYKDHDLKNELHIRAYETVALYRKK